MATCNTIITKYASDCFDSFRCFHEMEARLGFVERRHPVYKKSCYYSIIGFEYTDPLTNLWWESYLKIVSANVLQLDNPIGNHLVKMLTTDDPTSLQQIIVKDLVLHQKIKKAYEGDFVSITLTEDEIKRALRICEDVDKEVKNTVFNNYKEKYPEDIENREKEWELHLKYKEEIDKLENSNPDDETMESKNLYDAYYDTDSLLSWDDCYDVFCKDLN